MIITSLSELENRDGANLYNRISTYSTIAGIILGDAVGVGLLYKYDHLNPQDPVHFFLLLGTTISGMLVGKGGGYVLSKFSENRRNL